MVAVSILTRPEGRVLPEAVADYCAAYIEFQSSPDPKAGCYIHGRKLAHVLDVSILTRPEGRVLHHKFHRRIEVYLFQSSPDPKAGCYHRPVSQLQNPIRFNPHPTRRPGATIVPKEGAVVPMFQSSPDPKAGCYPGISVGLGRMFSFQSSPDPKAGCYNCCQAFNKPESSFNPHPTRRPGATGGAGYSG